MRSGFFNRAVFLMESIINIIIKIDDLLLILNVLFNECLYSEGSSILSAAENTLYFMIIDPVFTSFIMQISCKLPVKVN